MKFYTKEEPRIDGSGRPKVTTGNGVPGFNPKCNQNGTVRPGEHCDPDSEVT